MAKIVWDAPGERYYETGVSKAVLYVEATDSEGKSDPYGKGVAWNGITGVTESPSGAEATDLYADDIKYATLRSAEDFGATVEAYTYPDEFALCDGSAEIVPGVAMGQQSRRTFGLSYVTQIGNDTASESDDGYKLHLVWGATASPSEKGYSSINDSPEAITFSWEMTTVPVAVEGYKATASMTINTLKLNEDNKKILKELESTLYGDKDKDPRLPLPAEIISMFSKEEPSEENPEEPEVQSVG